MDYKRQRELAAKENAEKVEAAARAVKEKEERIKQERIQADLRAREVAEAVRKARERREKEAKEREEQRKRDQEKRASAPTKSSVSSRGDSSSAMSNLRQKFADSASRSSSFSRSTKAPSSSSSSAVKERKTSPKVPKEELTREELRAIKSARAMNEPVPSTSFPSTKRFSIPASRITKPLNLATSAKSFRGKAGHNLTKDALRNKMAGEGLRMLNKEKRDMRTIDEIDRDIRERKKREQAVASEEDVGKVGFFSKKPTAPSLLKPSPAVTRSCSPERVVLPPSVKPSTSSTSLKKSSTAASSSRPISGSDHKSNGPSSKSSNSYSHSSNTTSKTTSKASQSSKSSVHTESKRIRNRSISSSELDSDSEEDDRKRRRDRNRHKDRDRRSGGGSSGSKRRRSYSESESESDSDDYRRQRRGGGGGGKSMKSVIYEAMGMDWRKYEGKDVISDDDDSDMEVSYAQAAREERRTESTTVSIKVSLTPMKLLKKQIEKDGSGYIRLQPEDDEDMWHIYNLVSVGDEVRAQAVRRVQNVSSTGSTASHRVRTTLTLEVTKSEFSPSVQGAAPAASTSIGSGSAEPTSALHLSGRVTRENPHVKMGAFHTLDLEANRDFDIWKKDGWDSVALGRVEEATVEGRGAEVGAIVCGEGTATVCLLTEHMTVVRQRIDVPVPRKRKGQSGVHDKAMDKFFQTVYQAVLRHLPFTTLKAIVIASPGFTKDALFDSIFAEAIRASNKALTQSRSKWLRVHTTTSHVHALVEALRSAEVTALLAGTKYAREGQMLDKFHKMLGTDELRAWYGPDHVALAIERGAVGTLMISDELFRSSDVNQRKRYVAMVDDVRERSGEALIFSSMHESGQQLIQLTGVAAILNFPLDIEVVEMEEREEKERLAAEKKALANGDVEEEAEADK
ncbi:Meiotic cell division protein Pelota/DOM34 [Phaffia rhodozyma]|uniref:Meiotic cell division protein Pelota/DOM34 n=1 Tax=Phaffia rhodozyma TaxID=264483 RepID=A0A0F7SFF0_PHARH|nr:Meiotic cell division protein Pelota/DOM34 [Phaffia rhodozyma]